MCSETDKTNNTCKGWAAKGISARHPHIFRSRCYAAYPLRVMEGLEPIPVDEEAWYTLNRSPGHHRSVIQTQITVHVHTSNQPDLHVFGLCEEARVPEKNAGWAGVNERHWKGSVEQ